MSNFGIILPPLLVGETLKGYLQRCGREMRVELGSEFIEVLHEVWWKGAAYGAAQERAQRQAATPYNINITLETEHDFVRDERGIITGVRPTARAKVKD